MVELRGRESWSIILPKCTTSTEHLVFFYMPQIYDMGPTALLPLQGRRAEDFFFALKNPTASAGFEPRTWVLKASTLPLEHRSRYGWGLVVRCGDDDKYTTRNTHTLCPLVYVKKVGRRQGITSGNEGQVTGTGLFEHAAESRCRGNRMNF
jgi:hypothetical protein